MAASLLLRPGLSLSIGPEADGGVMTWAAAVALAGYSAAKGGFVSMASAFLWAADSVARFEASVVS